MDGVRSAGGRTTFGSFLLDEGRGCLIADGAEIPLRPKTFAILSCLAANPGRLVSKDELIRTVWRGALVSDDVLVQSIGELRRALGEKGATYIRTVPRRGYRFDAEVSLAVNSPAPASGPVRPASVRRRRWSLRIPTLVMLAAVLGILVWKMYSPPDEKAVGVARQAPGIAVLPFGSSAPQHRDLAEDLPQQLIDALGRFSGLTVKNWRDVQRYRHGTGDAREVARDLGVQYQIEADVGGGEHPLVHVRLVNAKGDQVRSLDFGGWRRNTPTLDEVGQMAAELATLIDWTEQRLAATTPQEDPGAYDIVQRARYTMRTGDPSHALMEGIVSIREQARRAIALDPDHAAARSLLAETYLASTIHGYVPHQDGLQKAATEAQRALALDNRDIRAHVVLAHVHLLSGRDEQVREELARIQAINPYDLNGRAARGHILVWLGQSDAALAALEDVRQTSLRLKDLGGWDHLALALAYYLDGRYQRAIDMLGPPGPLPEKAEPAIPEEVAPIAALLAASHARLDQMREARHFADRARSYDPIMASNMEAFVAKLRDPADQQELREGLVKAGLLAIVVAPTSCPTADCR